MKLKSVLVAAVIIVLASAFTPSVIAAPVFDPNVLVFTESSGSQLSAAWSAGSLPELLSSPGIGVLSLSPELWVVGLRFLNRTANTIGDPTPGNPAPPVPLGWTEPEGSTYNLVSIDDEPCNFDGGNFRIFETCIIVGSEFNGSNFPFRFTPLANGQVFSDAARLPGNSTPLNFAFVDLGDEAVATTEPSSFGFLVTGLVGLGFFSRYKLNKTRRIRSSKTV